MEPIGPFLDLVVRRPSLFCRHLVRGGGHPGVFPVCVDCCIQSYLEFLVRDSHEAKFIRPRTCSEPAGLHAPMIDANGRFVYRQKTRGLQPVAPIWAKPIVGGVGRLTHIATATVLLPS